MNEYEAYTPSEEQVRVSYMGDRIAHDGLSGEEALAEWTAFLARVRRDAAQEALDGLAEAWETEAQEAAEDGRLSVAARIRSNIAGVIGYRYSRFPEETP